MAAAGLGAMSRRSAAASPVCPVDDLPSGVAKQVGRRAFSHVAGAWILGIAAQVAEAAYDIGQTEEISDRERRILDAIRGVLNAQRLVSHTARRDWSVADVLVRVLPADGEPAAADRALADLVAAYLGVPVDQVHVGRRCPQCAATDHGRPVVRVMGGRRVHVSIARTPGRTAVAAGSTGAVGVDLERVDADRFSGVATVARHAGEPESATLADVAVQWVRKEAVLKATGWGVTYGPDRMNVTPDRPSPFPVRAGSGSQEVQLWVTDLDVGSGYAAAVAVVSPSPPRVLIVD